MVPFLKSCVLASLILHAMMSGSPAYGEEKGEIKVIKVEIAAAGLNNVETIVEAVGTTKANRSVKILPVSSGIVREIAFQDSQTVNAGDTLVKLDDEIERADFAEAQARLKEAEQSLARSRSLRQRDAVAVSSVDKLVAEVEIAKAEQERAARRLQDRTITAPFSGKIGFSDIEIGSHIKDEETIAVLDDLSKIKVEFFLPENLFGKVRIGTTVLADAAAFQNQTFKGQIEAIDTRINADSRSFKVRAMMNNEDGRLPAGMFLHLSLILDAAEVLSIPEEAVIIDGAQNYVFAVNQTLTPPKAVKTNIRIGRRAFGWVEITEGLAQGQGVVIRGIQKIKDGSALEILKGDAQQVRK